MPQALQLFRGLPKLRHRQWVLGLINQEGAWADRSGMTKLSIASGGPLSGNGA